MVQSTKLIARNAILSEGERIQETIKFRAKTPISPVIPI
jgi:hypothetical protein